MPWYAWYSFGFASGALFGVVAFWVVVMLWAEFNP